MFSHFPCVVQSVNKQGVDLIKITVKRAQFKHLKTIYKLGYGPASSTSSATSSVSSYVQGQSPKLKIREYFYYIDHQGQVGCKVKPVKTKGFSPRRLKNEVDICPWLDLYLLRLFSICPEVVLIGRCCWIRWHCKHGGYGGGDVTWHLLSR